MKWLIYPHQPRPDGSLSNLQLLRLVRGASRVYWGIVLALILGTQLVKVELLEAMRIPPYIVGLLLTYWGILLLYGAGPITSHWSKMSKACCFLGLILLYFTPFLYWWEQAPEEIYYAVNAFLFWSCTIFILVLLNQMASELALRTKDKLFALEAHLSVWAVVLMLGIPLLLTVIYAFYFGLRHQTSPFAHLKVLIQGSPGHMSIIVLLPFALTIINLWKTKQKCIDLMRN